MSSSASALSCAPVAGPRALYLHLLCIRSDVISIRPFDVVSAPHRSGRTECSSRFHSSSGLSYSVGSLGLLVRPSLCARIVGTDLPRLQLAAVLRLVSSLRLRRSLHHPSNPVSYPSRRCRHLLALPIALDTSWPGISARHVRRRRLVRPFRCPAHCVQLCTHFVRLTIACRRASSFCLGLLDWSGVPLAVVESLGPL